MLLTVNLLAKRFENYNYGKGFLETPDWKEHGGHVFELEIDSMFLRSTDYHTAFSNIVKSYSNNYEKFEFICYHRTSEITKLSSKEIAKFIK